MEDFSSLWTYQENVEELKQKLLYTTLELESTRAQANEEMKMNKENVKQLINLVKITCQERDEARNQLDALLNKLLISSSATKTTNHLSEFGLKPTNANISIGESNSLSEPYNYHSTTSSPVADSFFEPLADVINEPIQVGLVGFDNAINQESMVIDSLVTGKTLPEKGNLLQAVLAAGPLLQTLMVAGPLPMWRNPPPAKPLHIPPVSIQGFSAGTVDHSKPVYGTNAGGPRPFVEMSCGLNFDNGRSGSYNGRLVSAGTQNNCYIPNVKRQRFQ